DRHAGGDRPAMASIGGEDRVVGCKRFSRADGDGFLTTAKVNGADDRLRFVQLLHLLFEVPDAEHGSEMNGGRLQPLDRNGRHQFISRPPSTLIAWPWMYDAES